MQELSEEPLVTVGDGATVGGGGKPELVDHAFASQHNRGKSVYDALRFGGQSMRGIFRVGWGWMRCDGTGEYRDENEWGGAGRYSVVGYLSPRDI